MMLLADFGLPIATDLLQLVCRKKKKKKIQNI